MQCQAPGSPQRLVSPGASFHFEPESTCPENGEVQSSLRKLGMLCHTSLSLLQVKYKLSYRSSRGANYVRLSLNSRQALTARRHGYQRILNPPSTSFQNRTTVGLVTTRQRRLCHDGPVWPCTHALYPCIRRPPPRKHQRLPACSPV